jgi:hypothetical protein
MWTNLTKFWHKNEFKNIVWQKEPVGNYLETVLRNNIGYENDMQRNVTM